MGIKKFVEQCVDSGYSLVSVQIKDDGYHIEIDGSYYYCANKARFKEFVKRWNSLAEFYPGGAG